jgi:spore maturation protein CgeB
VKISFYGSSLVSAYWNGAATYFRGLLSALAARGHDVTFYEPDAYERQKHRDMPDPDWARVVVYPAEEAAALAAVRDGARADLVVKASGVGVFDALLEREVLAQRRRGSQVAFWDVDAPATLHRLKTDANDAFHPLIPQYDLVMTYGGGDAVVEAYTARGARRCVPVYNACDRSTHFPVAPDPDQACDLLFVGNRLPDRETRVRRYFLEPAAQLPHARFRLGGSGWTQDELPANVEAIGHVYTRQHNVLNCSAKAVLNVNRDSMAETGFSPPTRIFEAAAAGACIVSDAWDGIEAFLAPEEEVLVAPDGDRVAAYLEQLAPERARAIGQAARRRVLAEHTYDRRAAQVEAVLREQWSYA